MKTTALNISKITLALFSVIGAIVSPLPSHATPVFAAVDLCRSLFLQEKAFTEKSAVSLKAESQKATIDLTSQDALNVTDVSRAYRASLELRETMSRLSIAEARATSFPYFESQVKQALLILDTVSTEQADLHEEALRLISEKQLTMEKVTSILLRIETRRSREVYLKDAATARPKLTQENIDYNLEILDHDLKWSLDAVEEMAREGIYPFPTYAPLKIRSFRGVFPEVNPIGFVVDPRVSFDERKNVLAVKLPVHDLLDHRFVHHVTPGFFKKFSALENDFLKKFAGQNPPELLAYAEFRFFGAKHEEHWAQEVNQRMAQGAFDEDAVGYLKFGFEGSIQRVNDTHHELMAGLARVAPEAYAGLIKVYGKPSSAKSALRKLDRQIVELIDESLRDVFLNAEVHPNTESVAVAEAARIKKQMNEMSIEARRALSVPYFASQMKQSIELLRDLKASGFDAHRDLPTSDNKYEQLFFERLVDIYDHAEARVLKMDQTESFTMENITREMLTIEMLRSVATVLEKQRGRSNADKLLSMKYNIEIDDFARSLTQISRDAEEGYILFPSYAPLSVKSFSGLWPQVKPIGFSKEKMVSFDNLDPLPSVSLPIHDLIGHRAFRYGSQKTFQKFEALENEFLKRVRARNPKLEDYAQMRFFQATHEIDVGIEDSSGWTVEMQKHFENPAVHLRIAAEDLSEKFRNQFQNRFSDRFFKGASLVVFQELYPQGFASLTKVLGAAPFDLPAVHRLDFDLQILMLESIVAIEKN